MYQEYNITKALDRTEKMEKKIFRLMFVTIFIDYLSFGIIFPLLPYYIEKYGASPLLIGVIVGSFSLMQFVFSPFWGRLSDKVGRKKVIILSLFGTAIAHLILAFSFSIWGVLLSRIIAGIFTSASLPTTYALIADITKEEERAEKFGILGAAWGLGFIFGPALGGFLSTINYALPFFVAAGIAFLNCIFVYLIVPIVHKKKDGNQVKKEGFYNLVLIFHKLKDSIGILFILFFIVSFTLSGLEIVFPLFGKLRFSFNESNIGFTFTFIGVIIALTQGLVVGKLVKKIGEAKTIIVAHIAMILGYALLGISHQIVYMLLAVGILAS